MLTLRLWRPAFPGDLEMHIEALKTEQGLLDSALKILEDLKPSCLFTGPSVGPR